MYNCLINKCLKFCHFTSDLPVNTRSRLFIYADDIAIAFQVISRTRSCSTTRPEYVFRIFQAVETQPKCWQNSLLHFPSQQSSSQQTTKPSNGRKNSGTWSKTDILRSHTRQKLDVPFSRINMGRKLAGTKWGCQAKTLRINSTELVTSTASYCALVWMMSSYAQKIDTEINIALRIVCGVVDSTPVPWLYALSNIAPHHIVREEAAIRECWRIANDTELPIHCFTLFWCFYRNTGNLTDYKSRLRQWWQDVSVPNKHLIANAECLKQWNTSGEIVTYTVSTEVYCLFIMPPKITNLGMEI